MTSTVTMHIGDVRDVMARLPDNYADLLVTSPPFLALRSYLPDDHPDKAREIGSEPTPADFLSTLFSLTAEWGRLVADWGSICVELGDTMSGSGGGGGDYNVDGWRDGQHRPVGSGLVNRGKKRAEHGGEPPHRSRAVDRPQDGGYSYSDRVDDGRGRAGIRNMDDKIQGGGPGWPLAKSMCLMPHAYTIGLAYGHNPLTGQPHDAGQWRIRNVITWARPNPPVGSLGKRNPDKRTGDYKFRPACSFITVACRGTGRYFDLDAVRGEHNPNNHRPPVAPGQSERQHKAAANPLRNDGEHTYNNGNPAGAPPLDWHTDDLDGDWLWKLATAPYPGSHYATYPLALPRRLVLAMCPAAVCSVCGWPRERVTGKATYTKPNGRVVEAVSWPSGIAATGAHTLKVDGGQITKAAPTLGFTDCGHDNYRPGHVLDPFGGSGTTAVAAALEGRDATLIDLDRRNVDLVRRRLAENVRITSETHDGDTVVWTVETVTKGQVAADAVGQGELFAS